MRAIFRSLILIHLFSISVALAQMTPPLERKVSISYQNTPIDVALGRLAQEGSFIFSYSPSILSTNHIVSGKYSATPVREILIGLLGESIESKGRGNYIILTKATPPTKKEIVKNTVTISGYVADRKTGLALSEVSVYDKKSLTAVITNEFGFYKITVDNEDDQTVLFFSKRSFYDTLLRVKLNTPHFINITMTPEPLALASISPQPSIIPITGVPSLGLSDIEKENTLTSRSKFRDYLQEKFFSRNKNVNVNNIRDTIYRDAQLSFVPFVGTNHRLSGNIINGYSFNVLGGYSMGTTKLELGGLLNVDRGDVSYAQLAGLFNLVGGRTTGLQMAGLINLNRRKVKGAQFAGLINANLDTVQAAQFAGLFNINGRASKGAQFAGLFNVQPSFYTGTQVAGLFNVATHQMKGTQMAGLINYAHNIKGAQIGLFNYADSIRGIPLGLISFVSHGYHKIEISSDEVFYINTAFRTGVTQFYNILNAGMKPETWDTGTSTSPPNPENGVWYFGYGVGTAPKITKWMFLNLDFTANHVTKGTFTKSLSLLNKIYLGFDFQIMRKVSITAGATLNAYVSNPSYTDNPVLFTDFTPKILRDYNFSNDTSLKMWWGAKVGIRFL